MNEFTRAQLDAHKIVQCRALEQVEAVKEAQQHEDAYRQKEIDEAMRTLHCKLSSAGMQNEQLKLEVLRWRKQCSMLRLKLASAREKVQLHESNLDLVSMREKRLSQELVNVKAQLKVALQQLTDTTAAKMQAQTECDKLQGQALQADINATKLSEELKLATGRCCAAIANNADVQQQLTAALAEVASLQQQLGESMAQEAETTAQQKMLHEELTYVRNELNTCQERLAAHQKAAETAAAAAAKATAAAEAAIESLANKEQQLDEWKQLAHASKDTASQQLQVVQDKMGLREAQLLDEVASLKQQLTHEKSARAAAESAAEADGRKANGAAAAKKSLEAQVAQLNQQVISLQSQLAVAQQQAKQQADRAAALELDMERQQEHDKCAAVQAVDKIVQGLSTDAAAGGSSKAAAAMGAGAGNTRPSPKDIRCKRSATATAKPASCPAPTTGRASKAQANAAIAAAAAAAAADQGKASAGDGGSSEDDSGSDGVSSEEDNPTPVAKSSRMKPAAGSKGGAAKESSKQSRPKRGNVLQACDDNQQLLLDQDTKTATGEAAAAGVGSKGIGRRSTGGKRQPAAALDVAAPEAAAPAAAAAKPATLVADTAVLKVAAPPPLSFAPQSAVAPATALLRPAVAAAAQARVSASDMLRKLSAGVGTGIAGKPGARKRKLGPLAPAAGGAGVDVLPAALLVCPTFQAPKMKKAGY